MSKTYVGIKLQDLGLYNTLDPKDKIVIVKDKDEGVLQLKDFFLYVQSNLDLSNYYTSTQADTIFMAKVDAYTRKAADLKFALVEKTYTRTQADTRFALAADTFNKAEIEGKYASKEQMYTKDLVYTKEESITAFALKTEIPILPDLTPYSTTAKGDLRWALKVDVFSKTEADARFANINNYYTKSESDNKYALLSNTYTKAETDNKFLDTTEAYTKDYINLNIYTKTQVYTKAETDGKYPLKTDVYTVTAVNDQFAAKSWVYSRAEADNTFRKLADSYNRAEVNALIDASKSGLSTDVSNTYYTKSESDNKFELKGTAYNKIDSDAKYALISNSISPSQVAAKYYNKTEIDKSLGDAATNTSNLFALKSAAVGGVSLTPTNLTFTKVDGTSSLVAIPTWNQSTTGNAATATQLQTGRNIGITGAVTAAGVSFNGSSDININATSLDASKLTNVVPNASLNGTYTNVALDFTNKAIYSIGPDSLVAYGLASIRGNGTNNGYVMVIKTKLSFSSVNVINLNLKGLSDSETTTIDISINGWIQGNISKLSIGTKDYDIKKAKTPDGYLCFIMSHPSGYLGTSTAFSIVSAHINLGANPANLVGWSIYETNDISTLTNISPPCPQSTSIVNTFWSNVQNKPTTVSGYGITDAYTKADLYTKIESDNRFSFKQESIKSATLTTSTLAFTKADNTVSNISIPTWNQDTSGNSATATKLQTARTINGVSFDGSGNITTPAYTSLYSLEYRGIKPYQVTKAAMSTYFVDRGRMEIGEDTYNYSDLVVFNSWNDASGGNLNALLFGKSAGQGIWHYFTGQNSTTWGTAKQLAYTDSNITGNAASASKWQTARTFNITGDASWSASVDGTSDVTGSLTLANTGVNPGTYTKVTVDSKGRTTAASNLVPADIPNLDMSKVNTGVLGISQGGTAATTAATARTNLGLGTSAVLNVGAVNGVASLDASGKVPTSQLYINNTLTSTDTTVPLTAAQGKVLNDSIGVTNTNLQALTNRLDTNYYLKSDVFTKTEITTNYFDKTYINNNFLAQAANKDVSIAGFINAAKDLLFTTSLTGIKWNMNTDNASIFFKNNGDDDSDSYLGFDVGDNGDEYFRWSFIASSNNKVGMSLRRDRLEVNNTVATLGLSTSATLTDISKIPQYGIYSKGNIKTDGQIITNATSHHVNISDLGVGADSPIRIPNYEIPFGKTGYIPFLHGSVLTASNGYTMHSSLGLYRANDTWYDGGMYMAIGGDDRYPTAAFRFKLDGTIDFTGGGVSLAGNASSATKLQTARTISLTGDGSWSTSFDGTGNSTGSFVLSNSGVTAGTYTKTTVDSKGRVTSGTSLVAGDIPALDTSKLTSGILPIARGGTGAGDAATARNNLGLGTAATYGVIAGGTQNNLIPFGAYGIGSGIDINADFNNSDSTTKWSNIGSGPIHFIYSGNVAQVEYGSGIGHTTSQDPNNSVGTGLKALILGTVGSRSFWRVLSMKNPTTGLYDQNVYRLIDSGNMNLVDSNFKTVTVNTINTTTIATPPNVYTDASGKLLKSTYSFGTAATKNTGTNDGDVMTVGSFGIGTNTISYFDNTTAATVRSSTGGKSGIYRNSATGATSFIYSPALYMGTGDTHGMLSIDYNNYGVRVLSWHDSTVNTPFVRNLYHDKSTVIYNTTIDDVANVYIAADGSLKRATRLTYDSAKITGTINNANLTGTYDGISLGLTANQSIFTSRGENYNTIYGVCSARIQTGAAAIIIKTTIPANTNVVLGITIIGNTSGEKDIINLRVSDYTNGKLTAVNYGSESIPVRRGYTPDGYLCYILYDVNYADLISYSISVPLVNIGLSSNVNHFKGWSIYSTNDLTGYTGVSGYAATPASSVITKWNNVTGTPTTLAGYGISDALTLTGSDNRYVMLGETRAISLNNSVTLRKLSLARGYGPGGILWYSEGYTAWQDYMAPPGGGNGFAANITAPSGQLVTSWAKRSFIENNNGYGWTFESSTAYSTTPTVVAEIKASDGSARFAGGLTVGGGLNLGGYLNVRVLNSSQPFEFLNSGEAQSIKTGGVLVSDVYSDSTYTPTSGIYSKGKIRTKEGYWATDNRAFGPTATQGSSVNFYFTSEGGLISGNTPFGSYGDLITLNSYGDKSGGNANALFFDKNARRIMHFQAALDSSNWGVPKQLAYIDSDITGNSASATKLQTARTIGDRVFDGTGNITLGGTIQTDTIYNGSYIGFYTAADRNNAQQIRAGSILSSNTWYDGTNVPTNGIFSRGDIWTAGKVISDNFFEINNRNGSKPTGIALHPTYTTAGIPQYGIMFASMETFGTHGPLTSPFWSTYFTNAEDCGGWIFRNTNSNTNVASISSGGHGWFNYLRSSGDIYAGGVLNTGSYVSTSHLINRGGTYWSDNRHNFHAHSSGSAQGISIANLLVSDDYGQVGNVSASGIWAKGDIKSALSVYAGANVYVGNNVQFSTTGAGIRWDMNTDFARIYFKNDGNGDANSYLAFEVGDDNIEHFKWFISGTENMALKPQGLTVKEGLGVATNVSVAASKIPPSGIYSQGNVFTDSSLVGYRIGVNNTSSSSGQGISLYGGAVDGVPSYGLMFAGTGTFGNHGGVSGDWATYFTMTSGAQRGWIFRNLDYGNVASISSLGIADFAGTVTANGVRTTDIVISSTANIASGTVSGNLTVPDQSIISADGLAVNTRTANTKIRYALDYSPATAAAWINFSYMYDSTAGTNVITVKSSYNISNITRIGTGIYKVEFLRAFENEHFVMSGYARDDDDGGDVIISQKLGQVFTSTTAVFSVVSGSGRSMPTAPVCSVLFFGNRYGGSWLL